MTFDKWAFAGCPKCGEYTACHCDDEAEIARLRAEVSQLESLWTRDAAAVVRLNAALLSAAAVFKVLGNECIGITYRHEAIAAEVAARAAATGGM